MITAFVLGGGGVRGAMQVGMLRALFEAGVHPDLVLGSSVGAINGALVAAEPTGAVVPRLLGAWASPAANAVYGDALSRQLGRLARTRTHLHSPDPLRRLLERELGPGVQFADLEVPLRVVAASIERAAEHWFDSGSVIDAVLASASVPGVLPPTRVGDEHFIDGGIVNSIPVGEAVRLGAGCIFVLQGRVDVTLSVPRRPSETVRVAFEVARRHRFARELEQVPPGITVHVLPSGPAQDERLLSYRDVEASARRIEGAYQATKAYLETHR